MKKYTLEELREHVEDFLTEKAHIRSSTELGDVQTMATALRNCYKVKSPELALLDKFLKDLRAIRKVRFPKVVILSAVEQEILDAKD